MQCQNYCVLVISQRCSSEGLKYIVCWLNKLSLILLEAVVCTTISASLQVSDSRQKKNGVSTPPETIHRRARPEDNPGHARRRPRTPSVASSMNEGIPDDTPVDKSIKTSSHISHVHRISGKPHPWKWCGRWYLTCKTREKSGNRTVRSLGEPRQGRCKWIDAVSPQYLPTCNIDIFRCARSQWSRTTSSTWQHRRQRKKLRG